MRRSLNGGKFFEAAGGSVKKDGFLTKLWVDLTKEGFAMKKTILSSSLLAGALSASLNAVTVKQWEAFEKELTTTNSYTNVEKYRDVTLNATFTDPGVISYTVPGFWDGGNTWRIRFAPTSPGTWSYTISSSDSQLDSPANDGNFNCIAPTSGDIDANPNYRGFLKVSSNSRYLTYADGTPFFWMGDNIFFGNTMPMAFEKDPLDQGPDVAEFPHYVDNRKAKKFSVIHIHVGYSQPPVGWEDWFDWGVGNEGGPPFNASYSEIHTENFQWLDKRIKCIHDGGMIPAIYGLWGNSELMKQPIDVLKRHWKYLVARYQAYNVIWGIMGEYGKAGNVSKVRSLSNYVHDLDEIGHLTSIHPDGGSNWTSSVAFHGEAWIDFHMHQTWRQTDFHALMVNDYNRANPIPVFNTEEAYDGINVGAEWGARPDIRRAAWILYVSGGGLSYGAHGIWDWNDGHDDTPSPHIRWYDAIDLPSAFDMNRLVEFFSGMEWWEMSPRDDLVSNGYCFAEQGKRYVVYLSNGGSTTVNLGGWDHTAQWFNPRDGSYQAASGGPAFTAPNSDDWVLYVEITGEAVDTLVGLWHFDEGSGTTAYDSSGYGNDGTIHGASWTGGIRGSALGFDGTDDYVKTASSPALHLTDEITLEAWAYLESSTGGWQMIISREYGDSYLDEFLLGLNPDGYGVFYIRDNADQHLAIDDVALSTGSWHHLVGTYNGSVGKLYVDGAEEDSNSSPSGFIDAGTHPVVIGAGSNDNGASYNADPWNGMIDEVRIYSRALSTAEIKEYYDRYEVTLSLPNGGEDWMGTHEISWSTIRTALDSYRLLYSTDGGTNYPDTVASDISPDSSSWEWTVPAINCTTVKVKVQMLDAGSAVISEDESDSCFTIKGIGTDEGSNERRATGNWQLSVYPNPATTRSGVHFHLGLSTVDHGPSTLAIYDLTGRLVRSLPIHHLPLTIHQLTPGIYFYKITGVGADPCACPPSRLVGSRRVCPIGGRFTVVK
jgi:hypothetical protein